MADKQKYTKAQLPAILAHNSRAKDKDGNYIKFNNQNIDTNRTHLNYHLHDDSDGLTDFERIIKRAMLSQLFSYEQKMLEFEKCVSDLSVMMTYLDFLKFLKYIKLFVVISKRKLNGKNR